MYLVISFIAILLIGGCSKNNNESSAKKPGAKMKESKTLNEMQQGIEMLIKEFEETFLMQTAPTPKSSQEQLKPEESQKSEGNSKGKEGEGKQKESSPKPPEPDWASLEKKHYSNTHPVEQLSIRSNGKGYIGKKGKGF